MKHILIDGSEISFTYRPTAPCALCGLNPPVTEVRYEIEGWAIRGGFSNRYHSITRVTARLPFCETCRSRVKPFSLYLLLSLFCGAMLFLIVANFPRVGNSTLAWMLGSLCVLGTFLAYWKHNALEAAKRAKIHTWLLRYSNYRPATAADGDRFRR